MHYYLAMVVTMSKHGVRSSPTPYTIRAASRWEAEEKLNDHLGEGKYEIEFAEPIGYDDEASASQ